MKYVEIIGIIALSVVALSTGRVQVDPDNCTEKHEPPPLQRSYRQNERYSNCGKAEFRCKSGRCIKESWKCDIVTDCEDGDDEKNCTYSTRRPTATTKKTTKASTSTSTATTTTIATTASTTTRPTTTTTRTTTASTTRKPPTTTTTASTTRRPTTTTTTASTTRMPPTTTRRTTTVYTTRRPTTTTRTTTVSTSRRPTTTIRTTKASTTKIPATTTRKTDEVIKIVWKCNFTTSSTSVRTCQTDSMPCSNGMCIPLSWKCDGKKDCPEGEDETNCRPVKCNMNTFKCVSGRCLDLRWWCNGSPDCEDGDDELNCDIGSCGTNWFQCFRGKCIRLSWKCDGKKDCEHGDDEKNCGAPVCADNLFPCFSGRCIPLHWKCDGTPDCDDGDDEKKCGPDKCDKSNNYCRGKNSFTPLLVRKQLEKFAAQMNATLAEISWALRNINMQLLQLKRNASAFLNTRSHLKLALTIMQNYLKLQTANLTVMISRGMEPKDKPVTAPPKPVTVETLRQLLKDIENDMKKLPHKTVIPVDAITSCPIGFSRVRESCYYFSNQKGSFADASYMCKVWGSYLITIESQREDYTLQIGTGTSNTSWSGGNDILRENEFIWEEGVQFGYTSWAKHRPNKLYSGNCVSVTTRSVAKIYGWKDQRCSTVFNWVCEKNLTISVQDLKNSTEAMQNMKIKEFHWYLKLQQQIIRLLIPRIPVNASTSCPVGFIKYKNNCYFVSYDKVSWYMARYLCKEWGTNMLIIESQQKQKDIEELLKGKEETSFWTGGHGLFLHNKFVWDKTRKPFQYTNWSLRRFNTKPLNLKNCVYLIHTWSVKRLMTIRPWYDGPCDSNNKFICEKDLVA